MSLRLFYCLRPQGTALFADPLRISLFRTRTTAVQPVRGL